MILETPAYCGIKMKDRLNLLHRNEVELDVRILFLIIPIQIYGYGIGFIVAFIKRYILKQNEFAGFLRNFY